MRARLGLRTDPKTAIWLVVATGVDYVNPDGRTYR